MMMTTHLNVSSAFQVPSISPTRFRQSFYKDRYNDNAFGFHSQRTMSYIHHRGETMAILNTLKSKDCDTAYGHACITHLNGAQEYMEFLQQQEDEDEVPICVVRFSAEWCKACKSLDVRYHKLADYCQNVLPPEESVRFAEVMYKGNEVLCDTLGIKSFPCIHVYKGCQGLLSNLTGCKPDKNSETATNNMITVLKDELNALLEQRRLKREQGIDDDAVECVIMDIQDSST